MLQAGFDERPLNGLPARGRAGMVAAMPPPIPDDGLPPGVRTWAVLTTMIGVGLASLDTSIANTALPSIAADVHASPASSIWVVNAYQLALVATLLPFGALGEIFGYRRVYAVGLAVFTAASLVCALSWSLPTLTAARVLQGLGASGMMSVNTALVRFIYPRRMLGRGVGINAMTVAVLTALGPTVAAGILQIAAWPLLFAVNVPLGLVATVLALRVLPDTPRAARRFDLASALLNAAAFGLLVFGIGEIAHSASRFVVLLVLAAAVAAGAALVRRQRSLPVPMLPLDLYRRPMFALSSLTSVCSFAAQGLAYVSLPFLFQNVLGHSAVETGLLLTPWPVMTALAAPIAGPMSDRFPAGIAGRRRPCGAVRRSMPDGSPAAGCDPIRDRLASRGVRPGVRPVPIAQPARHHVERPARTQRRRKRHGRDVAPARPVHRRGAGRLVLWPVRAAWPGARTRARRRLCRRGLPGQPFAPARETGGVADAPAGGAGQSSIPGCSVSSQL